MSEDQPQRRAEKDPDEWATGDEPMTGPQESYLRTLAREAGEDVDPSLTKAQASRRIEELQRATGRGREAPPADEDDFVDEASKGSFPTSDPPASGVSD